MKTTNELTVSLITLNPLRRASFHRILQFDDPSACFVDGVVERLLAGGEGRARRLRVGGGRARAAGGAAADQQRTKPVTEVEQDGWSGVDDLLGPSVNIFGRLLGRDQYLEALVDDPLTHALVRWRHVDLSVQHASQSWDVETKVSCLDSNQVQFL